MRAEEGFEKQGLKIRGSSSSSTQVHLWSANRREDRTCAGEEHRQTAFYEVGIDEKGSKNRGCEHNGGAYLCAVVSAKSSKQKRNDVCALEFVPGRSTCEHPWMRCEQKTQLQKTGVCEMRTEEERMYLCRDGDELRCRHAKEEGQRSGSGRNKEDEQVTGVYKKLEYEKRSEREEKSSFSTLQFFFF